MVYLAGIVLALVLVVPTAWFPFQLGKIAVFATLLAVALVLFIVGRGSEELRRTHGLRLALLVALLPLAYLLSAQFSIDKVLAFTGFSIETDTVVFTLLAFLAFILSFTLFKTLRTVRLLLGVVFWALVAAAVFQWVSIVFGTSIIPFQTFTDRSVNLIGKWNDLGILVGLLAVFLIAYAEFEETTTLRRGAVVVGLLVFAVLLGVVNFAVVWGLILAFSLASGLLAFLTRRDEELVKRVPWYSLGAAVVSIAFILFGSALNLGLTSIFPVSSLEVRPSYSSTLEVINEERGSSLKEFAIGSGPNTFGEVWLLHKPNEVNQTQFWNLNFNVGFSTFVTALGSVGFVGGVMWLMPLFLVVLGILRAVRLGVLSREEKRAATTIGLGSLFLLIGLILYVPSPNIIILAFTLSGAAFGFLWRQGRSASGEEEVMPSRRGQMGALALALVCVVAAVWVGFAVDKRFVAEAKVSTGAIALQNGDAVQALKDASSSLDIEKNTDNARLFITAGNARLQQIAQDTKLAPADAQKQFADTLQPIIDTGKVAIAKYPNDYRLYFSLGQVYDFFRR
jgi:hypothetical protein